MINRRRLPILIAAPALPQGLAQGNPLRVLGTGATEAPIEELAHEFTRATGRVVTAATSNGGQVAARLRAGETPDVVLNAGPAMDALIREGFAHGPSRREVGRMRLGLAVRMGVETPDLSDETGLAGFLRGASSIGLSDGASGATSGRHVLALLERLGVTPETAGGPRREPFARGLAAVRAVARGEVFCVITQISEIVAVPEARLVAPLPEGLQLVTPYVAAIPTRAADPEGAARFIALATGPLGQGLFRAVGFAVG